MNRSSNKSVQAFLVDMQSVDLEKYEILQALRTVVFEVSDTITERIMYGGIMFTHEHDFGGIFASKHHVSFEFSNGYLFQDSCNHLEGTGKKRRHLKLRSLEDIEGKKVDVYVKQAIEMDT